MLKAVPGIKLVEKMTEAPLEGNRISDATYTYRKTQHVFNVKYVDPRVLPDSLVAVTEEHRDCKGKGGALDPGPDSSEDADDAMETSSVSTASVHAPLLAAVAEEKKIPCVELHKFTFIAPVYTYVKFVQGLNPIDPTVLAESLSVTLTIEGTEAKGAKLSLALKVENARYQEYFRQLRVNHLLPTDVDTKEPMEPTERELKAAFIVWAGEALRTVSK